MSRYFRVVNPDGVAFYDEPGNLADNLPVGGLSQNQILEISSDEPTIAGGLVWWQHDGGWSPSHSVSGARVWMKQAQKDVSSEFDFFSQPSSSLVTAVDVSKDRPDTIKMVVLARTLHVRPEPKAGPDVDVLDELHQYETVNVRTGSRTESSDYVWWEHEEGDKWLAQGQIDEPGNVYMKEKDTGKAKQLAVPWYSQLLPNSSEYTKDCGPACVLMLLRYNNLAKNQTVADLASRVKLPTNLTELQNQAGNFGLDTKIADPVKAKDSLKQSRQAIEEGQPSVLLVDYLQLGFDNPNVTKTFKHWIVITGYDETFTYVHDPYFRSWQSNGQGSQGGANLRITHEQLLKATYNNILTPV